MPGHVGLRFHAVWLNYDLHNYDGHFKTHMCRPVHGVRLGGLMCQINSVDP